MNLNKIPATVITGFLGSGKTTLLSSLLKQAAGRRIAVIMNEFGELDIDTELLRNCPLEQCQNEPHISLDTTTGFYELANGCICCTVEEEFLPVMRQLISQAEHIDQIIIETSGLALPKPLVQAFNWRDIREHCTVDAVITLIDGPAVIAGNFAHDVELVEAQRQADDSLDHDPDLQELLEDQLTAADMVVVSKNDLLDANQREQLEQIINRQVPAAVKTIYVSNGDIDLDVITGVHAASEQRIETIHSHHDHHHQQGQAHEHAHDKFDSFVIQLAEVNGEALQVAIKTLLNNFNIYRIKGFVALEDKPMRQVLQAVGKRLDVYFDRLWQEHEPRITSLVFIGKNIQPNDIKAALSNQQIKVD